MRPGGSPNGRGCATCRRARWAVHLRDGAAANALTCRGARATGGSASFALAHHPAGICVFESVADVLLMAPKLKQRVDQLVLGHGVCAPGLGSMRWRHRGGVSAVMQTADRDGHGVNLGRDARTCRLPLVRRTGGGASYRRDSVFSDSFTKRRWPAAATGRACQGMGRLQPSVGCSGTNAIDQQRPL